MTKSGFLTGLLCSLTASCAATTAATAPAAPLITDVPAVNRARGIGSTASAPLDVQYRSSQPPPSLRKARFQSSVPVEVTLSNGARLLVVENHAVPLVAVEVLIRTGVDGEPDGKGGLAAFTAALLTEGSAQHPAVEFSSALEDLAARLGTVADLETSRVHLNCLSETLPQALDLLAEALTTPSFRPEDVERVRGLLVTGLVQRRSSPPALAADQAARILYGERHPWGRPSGGTPHSLKTITRGDLVQFHQTWYRPNHAVIAVSGDVAPARVAQLLEEKLRQWRPAPLPELRLPAVPAIEPAALTVVEQAGLTQSQIWMVGRLFPADSPDHVAVTVANNVLGGLFTSRLNANLREQKGYSYGVYSSIRLGHSDGALYASGGVQAQYTAAALTEYRRELQDFAGGELREGELQRAKEAIIRGLPAMLETNDAVATSMAWLAHAGLPLDWYRRLPDRVAHVDATEVARVARQYFGLERLAAVVVGPNSRQALETLGIGPAQIREVESPRRSPRRRRAGSPMRSSSVHGATRHSWWTTPIRRIRRPSSGARRSRNHVASRCDAR